MTTNEKNLFTPLVSIIGKSTANSSTSTKSNSFFIFPEIIPQRQDLCNTYTTNLFTRSHVKCLIPSPNATSATIKIMNIQQVIKIQMDKDENKYKSIFSLSGRHMNRMAELKNFLQAAAICQWFVYIPNQFIHSDEAGVITTLNYIDFRQVGSSFDIHPHVMELCHSELDQQFTPPKSYQYWLQVNIDSIFDTYINPQLAHVQKSAMYRAMNAYLGIDDELFACQECSSSSSDLQNSTSNHEIVVYFRGEDIFDPYYPSPHTLRKMGQPPLDFYNKSIHHAIESIIGHEGNNNDDDNQNIHILLISKDEKNPVLRYFKNSTTMFDHYPYNISQSFEIRTPYTDVLTKLYCAKTLILGVSSMNMHMLSNPNLKRVYISREESSYSNRIQCLPQKVHDNNNTHITNSTTVSRMSLFDVDPDREDYIYYTDSNYSVFSGSGWTVSPEQLKEMMSFNSGYITKCNLDIFNHQEDDDVVDRWGVASKGNKGSKNRTALENRTVTEEGSGAQ